MECAKNPYFLVQSIDHYFEQDNPWIVQIHTFRITNNICRCYSSGTGHVIKKRIDSHHVMSQNTELIGLT